MVILEHSEINTNQILKSAVPPSCSTYASEHMKFSFRQPIKKYKESTLG